MLHFDRDGLVSGGNLGFAVWQEEGIEMKKSNSKKLRMALTAFVLGALTMPVVNGVFAETYVGSDSVTVDAETKEIKVKNMTQVEQDATGADVYSLSLGKQATADGQYALAVGSQAQAGADNASAFGKKCQCYWFAKSGERRWLVGCWIY